MTTVFIARYRDHSYPEDDEIYGAFFSKERAQAILDEEHSYYASKSQLDAGSHRKSRHRYIIEEITLSHEELNAESRAKESPLLTAAIELRQCQQAYLADPKDQRSEEKGRAVGEAAAKLDTAIRSAKLTNLLSEAGWQAMTQEAIRIQTRHLDNHQGDVYHAMQHLVTRFGKRRYGNLCEPLESETGTSA